MSKLARSGLILIVVAIVLGGISGGIFAYGIWKFASDEMVARELVPGTLMLPLEETGHYAVYHEYRSTVDGRTITNSNSAPNLDMTLREATQGLQVPLRQTHGNYSYERPSGAGTSLASFEIDQPGDYVLEVTSSGAGEYVIAIGQPRLGLFLTGMASLFCGGGLAGIMLLVGIVLLAVGLAQGKRTT